MIRGIGFTHKTFKFPVGEMQVNIVDPEPGRRVSIHFIFEKMDDVYELLLVCNALYHRGMILEGIAMPYVPFGRQDRVSNNGESFSLEVFASLINACNAKVVDITDPHSDVTTALIHNCNVTEQYQVFKGYFKDKSNFFLVSPDGGALKKIYKLAKEVDCYEVIECSKQRNTKTGEITGVVVHATNLVHKDCYIVDDICDGGRTFVEIAKALKEKNAGKIVLMVTHGFFTKGLGVFDGLIDEVYTMKGKVK